MVRNLRGSRILAGAVVVLLLGAVYGLAGLRHTVSLTAAAVPRSPRVAAVTSVQRVCPAPGASTSPGGGVAVMTSPAGRFGRGRRRTERDPADRHRQRRARPAGAERHPARRAAAGPGGRGPGHRPQDGAHPAGSRHQAGGTSSRAAEPGPGRAPRARRRPGHSSSPGAARQRAGQRPGQRGRGHPGQRLAGAGPGGRADRHGQPAHRRLHQPGDQLLVLRAGPAHGWPDRAVPDERGQPGGRRRGGHLHRCRAAAGDHRHRDQRAAARHDRPVAGWHAAQFPGHRAARPDQRRPGRGGRPGGHRRRPGDLAAAHPGARQAPGHPRAARGGRAPGSCTSPCPG